LGRLVSLKSKDLRVKPSFLNLIPGLVNPIRIMGKPLVRRKDPFPNPPLNPWCPSNNMKKSYAAAKRYLPVLLRERQSRGDFETLTSRIIDRSLRPLFPKGFNYPVVITVMVLSSDSDVDMQIASLHSAMASLYVSDIPITKALAGVRVGKIDGEVVVNPTLQQQDSSTLDLLVVGDSSDILMIEMCVNASLDSR